MWILGLKELKPLCNDHASLNNGHFLLSPPPPPRWLLYRGWSTVSRILNHVQHCCTVVNRPLRAVEGSCTQNKPSTLLTVHIYFLALNQRWVSEEQGEKWNRHSLSYLFSIRTVFIIRFSYFLQENKTKSFHLKSSYGNNLVNAYACLLTCEEWPGSLKTHAREVKELLCVICPQPELCYDSFDSF